jgi:hypothetical protein
MRLATSTVLLCSIAASTNLALAAPALVAPLSSSEIADIAAEFSDFFVNGGTAGLWQQIQACYKKASSLGDTKVLRNCIVMDEAGKALDDNRIKATGGRFSNREWYEDSAFKDRMTRYSAAAFDNPDGYLALWENNKAAFGTALKKINLQ